jgi:methylmalonyl-CoA mutase N-terminal domain/subunit
MAEVIDFEVKSDIGKATADTKAYVKTLGEAKQDVDDLNESISIQGDVINDLEKDLIKMEAQLEKL